MDGRWKFLLIAVAMIIAFPFVASVSVSLFNKFAVFYKQILVYSGASSIFGSYSGLAAHVATCIMTAAILVVLFPKWFAKSK